MSILKSIWNQSNPGQAMQRYRHGQAADAAQQGMLGMSPEDLAKLEEDEQFIGWLNGQQQNRRRGPQKMNLMGMLSKMFGGL